jgi:hypothetical protein
VRRSNGAVGAAITGEQNQRGARKRGVDGWLRGLGLGFDPEIARGADPDIEGAGLRVDHEMAVLVDLNDA